MDESQLLNHLLTLENSSRRLMMQIQIWHDGEEKDLYISQKADVDNEIETTKIQLRDIKDKAYSARQRQTLIDQLREYKNQIRTIRHPYRLLPTDSINIENSLFSNLNSHMKAIAIGRQWGIHIPILGYTRDENNSVEIENFTEFLDDEIERIRNIEIVNFVNLKTYQEEFQIRLIERFIH